MISSSFVKSSAVKKIGKRTTLHLECRKKWKEKKAEKSRGRAGSHLYIYLFRQEDVFFFFGFDYSFFCFSLFPTCNPILPLYPPSFSPPPRLVHPPTPSKAQNESLPKVEIKVVGSIIKKFYLERVEWEKNGMSSLSFFSFFLSS